ncbi:hypothetical protein CLG96_05035 [Sphingomonas oleivorans]|uniref:Uncharacterized protein n=1 Tax=Sphingomonas oleivorans TaxID=1735121 RepID=A0A2T5G2T3_9SPHN|nr:glycosyltransferase family 39 protein [Sphingomonas oleivorans]PTQ13455.1 hypothetical protein CLG96_05035 [Sphingomonas oleivorans]
MTGMKDDRLKRWWALAALLLIAGGMAFRIWKVTVTPLWLDEAYSAYAAGKGFAFLWQVVPRYETHPPFYYSLVRLWTLIFGDGLVALRSFGFASALATMPVAALAARELARIIGLGRQRTAAMMLAALAFAAFAPLTVQMGREVRPYPLMILVYATAIWALLRVLRHAGTDGRIARGPFAFYLVALALMMWLHNLGLLYAAALGLAALLAVARKETRAREWMIFLGGHVLVALAWLPALMILVDQAPTWVKSTWLTFRWWPLPWRLLMLYAGPGVLLGIAAGLLAAMGTRVLARTGERRRALIMLLLTGLLPVALSVGISALLAPVFIMRTMTPVAIPAALLIATGAATQSGWRRWLAAIAFALMLGQMIAIDIRARSGGPPQNWYGAVRWLAARFRPGDMVYAYPNEGALPFDYAVRDMKLDMPSRSIPTPVPSIGVGGWYPTGSRGVVSLPRDRLRAIARERGTQAVPTIWLLRLGPWAYDKGDMFLDELSVGREQVGSFRSGPIDIIGLRKADLPSPSRR